MNQSTPFNALFPVFLKPDKVRILIVGGGKTGYEKLYFILKNSPFALISLVAPEIIDKIRELAEPFENVSLVNREFLPEDLKDAGILILATGKHELNQHIRRLAVQRHILTNVADTPELCDFYLGAIVTKGDLKIAISTNGKSPTMARRLREIFEYILPDEIQDALEHLYAIRKRLKGDFRNKLKMLNELTSNLVVKDE